jgi:hypothetical protein
MRDLYFMGERGAGNNKAEQEEERKRPVHI